MVTFSSYASEKFGILERHDFPLDRAAVEHVLKLPDITEERESLIFFERKLDVARTLRVACKKEGGALKVITFYPVKHE